MLSCSNEYHKKLHFLNRFSIKISINFRGLKDTFLYQNSALDFGNFDE